MATNLYHHVHLQLRQNKSDKAILSGLIDQGYTVEYSERLLAQAKADLPFYLEEEKRLEQEHRESVKEEWRATRNEEHSNWRKTVAAGVGLCALGLLYAGGVYVALELLNWDPSESRKGLFVVLGAPLLGLLGILTILKGVYHRIRWW